MLFHRTATVAIVSLLASWAVACPFCAAPSRTLSEEMADSSAVLLTRLAEPSEASERLEGSDVPYGFIDPETGAARFQVEQVLIGDELMQGVEEVEAVYFGKTDGDRLFYMYGVGVPPEWAIPLALSPEAAAYLPKLLDLPEEGADRLEFFQDYLEHEDPLLAQDAYDEFARAPYQVVVDLGPRMDRPQLRAWIEDTRVTSSRRSLYLTMLGVCGEAEDIQTVERLLSSDARVLCAGADFASAAAMASGAPPALGIVPEMVRFAERGRKLTLDAMIACYMTLSGKHGDPTQALDLVDRRFLANPHADNSNVYAVLQALRFLAEEQRDLVPLDRVLQSARLLLDNPDFADQVIPDLARWEDWSVLERLATMYRRSFDESDETAPVKYVREPIITYLDVAAELEGDIAERAKSALAEIVPLDPKAVERARSLKAFGFLAQARAKSAPAPWEEPTPKAGAEASAPTAAPQDGPASPDGAARSVAEGGSSRVAPGGEVPGLDTQVAEGASAEPNQERDRLGSGPRVQEPAQPPSRIVLVGAPIFASALLVGLFWLILRGGLA